VKRFGPEARIALGLFVFGFFALLLTEKPAGFVRDESVYFAAAESHARWFQLLLSSPSQAVTDAAITQAFDFNHEHPALMKNLFGLSFLLFHEKLGWLRPAAAFRVPAFLFAALILPLTYAFARRWTGRVPAIFAAVSFLLVPRQFFEAHLSCFDVPVATMWLLTVYCFCRAMEAGDVAARASRWWLYTGLSFGAALATKHNALFLPAILAPFALGRAWWLTRGKAHARWLAVQVAATYVVGAALILFDAAVLGPRFQSSFTFFSPPMGLFLGMAGVATWRLVALHREDRATFHTLATLVAMAVLGPVIFYAHWPYLWHAPVDRTAWYLAFHATHNHYAWFYLGEVLRAPPFPLAYVFVVTALTVPTPLFVGMALGWFGALGRGVRAARALLGTAAAALPEHAFAEAVVLVNAVASMIIISHPDVPHFGGVKHWFPSMPFLAVCLAWSLERAAKGLSAALAERQRAVPVWGASLALASALSLAPLVASARVYPYGTSHYSELAGGLPGAASLGMQRQFWANNVTGVLPWINEHARPGERVYLHECHGGQIHDYQRNGMLRTDLRFVGSPFEADLVAYQYHQEFREHEFNTWQSLGTTRPSTGVYVDETPQIVVYRRPAAR